MRTIGFLALAAVVAVLAFQNRTLRSDLRIARRALLTVQVGSTVPSFVVSTIDGTSLPVAHPDGPPRQALFVFNVSCAYCRSTAPFWAAIAARHPQAVIGLSLDSATASRAWAAEHGIAMPIGSFPDERTAATYRIVGVPITLVVTREGGVLFAHAGALTRSQTDTILVLLDAREGA